MLIQEEILVRKFVRTTNNINKKCNSIFRPKRVFDNVKRRFFIYTFYLFIIYTLFREYINRYHILSNKVDSSFRLEGNTTIPHDFSYYFSNYIFFIIMTTLLYIFGNYHKTFDFLTMIFIVAGIFFMQHGATYLTFTITYSSLSTLSGINLFVVLLIMLITLFYIIYHFVYAYGNETLGQELEKLFLCIVLFAISYISLIVSNYLCNSCIVYQSEKECYCTQKVFHLHHWQISAIALFLTDIDTVITRVVAGILYGVMIEGYFSYDNDCILCFW